MTSDLEIKIGSCGWNHTSWKNNFYPSDLPTSWYLTYYANEFPVVLIPESDWRNVELDVVAHWIDATPTDFQFFIEISTATGIQSESGIKDYIAKLLTIIRSIHTQLGGFIISCRDTDVPLNKFYNKLVDLIQSYPVYLEFSHQHSKNAQLELINQFKANVCWNNQNAALNKEGEGPLAVARITTAKKASNVEIRRILESFALSARNKTQAVIFFDGNAQNIGNLQSAKTIIELIWG